MKCRECKNLIENICPKNLGTSRWYCAVARTECEPVREIARARGDKLPIKTVPRWCPQTERSNGRKKMYQWLVRFGKDNILMDFLEEYEMVRGDIRELTVIISVVFLFQIAIKLWNRYSTSHNSKKVKLIKCDMLNLFNNRIKFLNYIFSSIMLYLAAFAVSPILFVWNFCLQRDFDTGADVSFEWWNARWVSYLDISDLFCSFIRNLKAQREKQLNMMIEVQLRFCKETAAETRWDWWK